jgi:hypothetical protein
MGCAAGQRSEIEVRKRTYVASQAKKSVVRIIRMKIGHRNRITNAAKHSIGT